MSFNAGGANVSGVQAIEQGKLIEAHQDTTFSVPAGETQSLDWTVPAGKKWILKNFSESGISFVGTQSLAQCQIIPNGTGVILSSSSSSDIIFNPTLSLTLSEGQVIRARCSTSAWTSGQKRFFILYQELNS